ncbi:MAG: TonB-dependent receptor [Deltaproteobacteria bacterium]|nr:TonB-dependent receptor [Deltaproteobacteria bacterium]
MRKLFIFTLFVAVCLGIITGDALVIYAQDTASEEFTLEEVMVTAQKREENQQKVGIAMEVITGDQLKELGRTDVDQILQNVSTALVQRTADGLRIGLRGVTYDTPAGYGDGVGATPGTVSINVDGVFTQRNPTGTGLYDIERVEVLYGPQTTTYASNAPGGIVNIEIARPKLDKYEFSGALELGNYSLRHGEVVVNAPIGSMFALRVSGNMNKHDGYVSNGADDEDSKSGRLRALFQPNEKLSFLITGEIVKDSNLNYGSVRAFKNQDDVDDPWYSDEDLSRRKPTDTEKKKYWGNFSADFGLASLVLIPSKTDETYHRTSSTLRTDGTISVSTSDGDGYERGIEARLTSPEDSKFKWLLVYNYYKGETFRLQRTVYEPITGFIDDITEMRLLLNNKAFLGDITYPITDRFRALAGARYSSDRAISSRTTIQTSGMGRDTYSDMDYSSPNYKVGVEYDVSENSMLYGTFTTSYRVEQEAMAWDGSTLPAQKMNAYTAGTKNRFMGNKLQLNASAFYYDYKNRVFQAMQFPTVSMSNNFAYCDPDAEPGEPNYAADCRGFRPDEGGRVPGNLTMKGADIQTSWIMTPKDKIDVSVSYLDSWIGRMIANFEFKDQPYASPENADFSNRAPTFSPKWTVTLNYNHNFTLGNAGVITARFDTKYQSSYEIDWWEERGGVDQRGYKTQEPHRIDNFTMIYANPGGKWTLSGYVKNILNYAEKRFMNAMGVYNMSIGPPRTFGGILSVRY